MNTETTIFRPGRPKDTEKCGDILSAANKLFLDNGYTLTSMEAVAKQAGVSKLTIYSHFADKKELFRAVIQNRCERMGMPVSMTEFEDARVEEALLTIARSAMDKILQPETIRLIRIIQADSLHQPEIGTIYYDVGPKRVKAAFAKLLAHYTAQKRLSIPNPERASEQFFTLLKGDLLQKILILHAPIPSRAETDAHIVETIAFFLAAYGPVTHESR